jgi:hypothetical protein
MEGCLHKLVLVVAAVASREPLERWVFDVQREDAQGGAAAGAGCGAPPSQRLRACCGNLTCRSCAAPSAAAPAPAKTEKDISAQIAAIIRQARSRCTQAQQLRPCIAWFWTALSCCSCVASCVAGAPDHCERHVFAAA